MEKVEIRETMPGDAGKAIEYMKRIGGETDNLTFGREGLPLTVEQEAAYLQQVHDDVRSVHYSVWKNGEMIGDGSITGSPRRTSHYAEMGLSVVRAEWNKGIGGMIVNKLIEYARQNGIEIVKLEVRSDNMGAIHLYEKYGFQRVGTLPAYFKIGDEYFDFEIMCLDLR